LPGSENMLDHVEAARSPDLQEAEHEQAQDRAIEVKAMLGKFVDANKKAREFGTALIRSELEVIKESDGMFLLRDIPALDIQDEYTTVSIIVRKVTEEFWKEWELLNNQRSDWWVTGRRVLVGKSGNCSTTKGAIGG
jgi:beta-glucosidase-like glycosyl hydrolase